MNRWKVGNPIELSVLKPLEFVVGNFVQGCLKVIQDDRIGKALEDKCQLPERVETTHVNDWRDSQDVDDHKHNAYAHARHHDEKPRIHPHEFKDVKIIAVFNVPEQVEGSKYPPWVTVESESVTRGVMHEPTVSLPAQSLKRPCPRKEMFIKTIEISKVGVDFQDPVSLGQDHRSNVYLARPWLEKWLVFHPGDDIMQGPGHHDTGRRRGKIPSICRRVEKDGKSVRKC